MAKTLEDALKITTQVFRQEDVHTYRQACRFLVDNKDQLQQSVYIYLPGGLSGNNEPEWAYVKENSDSLCGCGNERVINPTNPRTSYVASESGQITFSEGQEIYLKPIGAHKDATLMMLEIKQDALTFMKRPFAPVNLDAFMEALAPKGYKLDMLADALSKQGEPVVMKQGVGIPIFRIYAVDPKENTVTIGPDKAVEIFNPADVEDLDHRCGE